MLPLLAVLVWFAAGSMARADVQIRISDGHVTLHARDATVRQILEQWARVGQTRIVNVEKIPGGLVTLDLENVPEAVALDTLLRSISGYLAAPRAVPVANLSHFDRIVVIPTSVSAPAAAAAPVGSQPAAVQRPAFPPGFGGRPPFPAEGAAAYPRPGVGDQSDDGTPITNVVMPNRGGVFNSFAQPQVVDPNNPNVPAAAVPQQQQQLPPGQFIPNPNPPAQGSAPTSTMPVGGASLPGIIIQPPQQNPTTPQGGR
jgi:hypothetical protein